MFSNYMETIISQILEKLFFHKSEKKAHQDNQIAERFKIFSLVNAITIVYVPKQFRSW